MIYKGTLLNVVDNSGARKASCIHICGGFRKKFAQIGDIIIVSIKSLRSKRRKTTKVKKGDVVHALVVRSKIGQTKFSNERISYFENAIVLLTSQKKTIANRIFGSILKTFRNTKFLRIASLGSGVSR